MSGNSVHSFKVLSTLTAYRVVAAVSGTANTVQYPEATTKLPLGVTINDVKDINQGIPVQMNGIARLYFYDSCTTGQLVAFNTNGQGIPYTVATTYTALTLLTGIIGILVDDTVQATGTIANISIQPQLIR